MTIHTITQTFITLGIILSIIGAIVGLYLQKTSKNPSTAKFGNRLLSTSIRGGMNLIGIIVLILIVN